MGKNRPPRAIFENIGTLTAQDIEASNILKGLLKVEVPKAIEYAIQNKKTFASIFEINDSNSYIELHKNQWISALETCILFYVEEEDYEACNKMTKLIESYVRRKKKTQSDKKKEMFVQMINSLDEIFVRQGLMYADMDMDMFKYDEKFLAVIDVMIYFHFGEACSEVIAFYLYDRQNPDGTLNPILDENDTEIILQNPYDLWNLLVMINPKIQD
jgi:hypothetical protein